MDDASLDDFLSDGTGADDDTASDESSGGTEPPAAEREDSASDPEHAEEQADPADEQSAGEGVAPATTTSRWVEGGEPCAVCASPAERLWESPDGLVCATCKEW
jgi:hypothetical protein